MFIKRVFAFTPSLTEGVVSLTNDKTVEFLINSQMVTGEIIPVAGGHDINLNSGI